MACFAGFGASGADPGPGGTVGRDWHTAGGFGRVRSGSRWCGTGGVVEFFST